MIKHKATKELKIGTKCYFGKVSVRKDAMKQGLARTFVCERLENFYHHGYESMTSVMTNKSTLKIG